MTSLERVMAAIEGRPADRPPFMAWGPHMNMEDRHIEDFTAATCNYEDNHGFDMVKVMPNGLYHTEDYGQIVDWADDCDQPNFMRSRVAAFQTLDDWMNLEPLDVTKGAFGREVEVVRRVSERYKGKVPVIATVFSPIETLIFASGHLHEYLGNKNIINEMFMKDDLSVLKNMCKYFEMHEKEFKHAMEALSETTKRLMQAFLDAGASGFFYAMFLSNSNIIEADDFVKYVKPYDVDILKTVEDRSMFTMLHVCGASNLLFDQVIDYPVTAFNWEDQSPYNPSIGDIRKRTDKVLVGGIDRHKDLLGGDRELIKRTIREKVDIAMREGGNKLIISGGCEWPRKPTHRFNVWREVMNEIAEGK